MASFNSTARATHRCQEEESFEKLVIGTKRQLRLKFRQLGSRNSKKNLTATRAQVQEALKN